MTVRQTVLDKRMKAPNEPQLITAALQSEVTSPSPNCGLFYCGPLQMLQWSSTPARGDSNSINRNFNIYSLGGFPPIIYDDQRDVKGGHLFPL